jgi:hypothetical protein
MEKFSQHTACYRVNNARAHTHIYAPPPCLMLTDVDHIDTRRRVEFCVVAVFDIAIMSLALSKCVKTTRAIDPIDTDVAQKRRHADRQRVAAQSARRRICARFARVRHLPIKQCKSTVETARSEQLLRNKQQVSHNLLGRLREETNRMTTHRPLRNTLTHPLGIAWSVVRIETKVNLHAQRVCFVTIVAMNSLARP